MKNNIYQEQFYIFSKEKTTEIVKDFIKNNSNKIYDLFEIKNDGSLESLEDYKICQDIFENQLYKKSYEVIEKDNNVMIKNNLLNCLLNIKPEKSNISKTQAKNIIENFLNSKNIAGDIDDFFIISRTYLRKIIQQFVGAINFDLKNHNIINVFKLKIRISVVLAALITELPTRRPCSRPRRARCYRPSSRRTPPARPTLPAW